jgi:glycosyltransferase involved in cell wall biosynthesis
MQYNRRFNKNNGKLPPVALVHDWLTGMRGGEKVLDLLCRLYPSAPLWTLLHCPGEVSKAIEARPIYTSLLQHMPYARTCYRNYLPLFPFFAEFHKAQSADLVISTSHAVAKAMVSRRDKRKPFHICYIHTPMRYVWDMFDEYFGPARVGSFLSRFFFRPIAHLLQSYDKLTTDRVDLFLANSRYVADRVRRIYGREALVLPPPVNTERFIATRREPEDWYLVVSALVPYKKVDQAIRACAALHRRLKLVGKGPDTAELKRLAEELGADVDFVGYVCDDSLSNYYGRARALLFPGVEDFGIVPVEAIACGCPVIALGIGGVLDSMTPLTSVLYKNATVDGLTHAMLTFESQENTFKESDLREQALRFSEASFLPRLERMIRDAIRPTSEVDAIDGVRGRSHESLAPLATTKLI